MPSLKAVKQRIKSVKNTKKVTKTMELISAVKFQKLLSEIKNLELFRENLFFVRDSILKEINKKYIDVDLNKNDNYTRFEKDIKSFNFNDINKSNQSKKNLFVVVSADKGLSGDFLVNIKRFFLLQFENQNFLNSSEFILIGKKMEHFLKTKNVFVKESLNFFSDDQDLLDEFLQVWLNKLYLMIDSYNIFVIYSKFIRVGYSEVTIEKIFEDVLPNLLENKNKKSDGEFLIEPDIYRTWKYIFFELAKTKLLYSIKSSLVTEHYARMVAMKNATNNASDMLKKLVVQYNKKRQEYITKEVSEIIGGMIAQTDYTNYFENKKYYNSIYVKF